MNTTPHDIGIENLAIVPPAIERERLLQAAVRRAISDSMVENNPGEHRTGCGWVLGLLLDILIEDRRWNARTAVDALVLEAVRAGGTRERRARP